MRAVHDAPSRSPWVFWPLGILTMALAGLMLYRDPDNWKVWASVGVFGAAIVPGLLPFVVGSLRPLVGLFKSYKNGANGGAGPKSDGNSP